jgi:hypothetical protein
MEDHAPLYLFSTSQTYSLGYALHLERPLEQALHKIRPLKAYHITQSIHYTSLSKIPPEAFLMHPYN